jgi:hypothetical protein
MKYFYLTMLFFMLISSPVFTQTGDEVYREANPQQIHVEDNSGYAVLFKQMINAKHSGDAVNHNRILAELKSSYPERFTGSSNLTEMPSAIDFKSQPPFEGDWGTNDYPVNLGPVYVPPANNTKAGLDMEADSMGNKYVGYITNDRNLLVIRKSTDQGATWPILISINPGGATKWHSFDMFIADSSNGTFKIGVAGSRTSSTGTLDGDLYWMSWDQNGGSQKVVAILSTPSGFGHINPSIVADSYDFSPALTYWYVTFQRYNTGTNTGVQCLASLSANWGSTWTVDTVRSGFNDFNLDMEYKYDPGLFSSGLTYESLYVSITNDVTITNPNLRIFRISLGSFGSATSWTQFNLTSSSDPEFDPELAVIRQTREMAVVYTQTTGGTTDIKYNFYTPGGGYWTNLGDVANFSNNCERPRIDCNESQGAYRVCYVSKGSTDTIVYTSGFSFPFTGRTIASINTAGATTTSPDVFGFRTGPGAYGGGVVMVGGGQNGIWYDGSNVTPTGISQTGNETPETYSLSQNYPNPFNPVTNINFSIPKSSFVTLKVYDMLGREIASLVSGELTSGTYKVDFNASEITSGVYFYKIQAGDFTDTKKMILIK